VQVLGVSKDFLNGEPSTVNGNHFSRSLLGQQHGSTFRDELTFQAKGPAASTIANDTVVVSMQGGTIYEKAPGGTFTVAYGSDWRRRAKEHLHYAERVHREMDGNRLRGPVQPTPQEPFGALAPALFYTERVI
jgi:hypothetical protein